MSRLLCPLDVLVCLSHAFRLVRDDIHSMRKDIADGEEALLNRFLAPGQIDDQRLLSDPAHRPTQDREFRLLQALQTHQQCQLGSILLYHLPRSLRGHVPGDSRAI